MSTEPQCKECNDTGKRLLPSGERSNYLDCSCPAAIERAEMDSAALDYVQRYEGDLQHAPEDVRWFVHQRARQLEREAQAARIADLERQLAEAEDLIAQTSHGAAERISDLERKVDAHRAEAHGLREAIFPRKIQDSKAWRVVPMSHLGGILQLIDPPPVEVDGQTMVFQNPHAAEVLRKISALVRAMLDEPLPEAAAPSTPAVEQQPVKPWGDRMQEYFAQGSVRMRTPAYFMADEIFDWRKTSPAAPQAADTDKVREALPGWERGIATVTMNGHQLREALNFINPDGPGDELQCEDELTFGIVQHKDDDGKVSTGLCCWNDDTEGVYPLDGDPDPAASMAAQAPVREVPEGMPITQEPKYGIRDNRLFNRASGEFIPEDEPVFIFRARDRHAIYAIAQYKGHGLREDSHKEAVGKRIQDFRNFMEANPARMKEPDTALPAAPVQQEGV